MNLNLVLVNEMISSIEEYTQLTLIDCFKIFNNLKIIQFNSYAFRVVFNCREIDDKFSDNCID